MKYAICNETFEGWEHARVCQTAARLGYQGLEMAPYTLAPRITEVTPDQRRLLRRQAEDAGLKIIGLHWLLAKTEGFQVTAADEAVRQRTACYLVELARCCRDLGGDLMVFGSPGQRPIPTGSTRAQAVEHIVDTFRRAAPGIQDSGVRLCLEPLSPPEATFINTCDEALEILGKVNRPNFLLHLDVKAMSTEEVVTPELISRHGKTAGHFHANDVNRRGPGFGTTDFVPIFRALAPERLPGLGVGGGL